MTREGEWTVVQQGMDEGRVWRAAITGTPLPCATSLKPHTAIVGESLGEICNLVDGRAKPAQSALLAIVREDPARTLAEVRRLEMQAHYDVRETGVNQRWLGAVLALAHAV